MYEYLMFTCLRVIVCDILLNGSGNYKKKCNLIILSLYYKKDLKEINVTNTTFYKPAYMHYIHIIVCICTSYIVRRTYTHYTLYDVQCTCYIIVMN